MPKEPFIPEDLPVKLDYNLITETHSADAELAKLDVVLKHIPNPKLLGRTFAAKEALLSSQIEGTIATLNEVFAFEVEQEKMNMTRLDELQEVSNYTKALEQGIELLDQNNPLTERIFKTLHRVLLQSGRGSTRAPGEYRRIQVYIGKPGATPENASYVPPLPPNIPALMSNLEKYLNTKSTRDPLVQIAIGHYQFEAIHPFLDGNGRVGRLLISLLLYKFGILTHPFIYLSEFFEEHRRDYYDLLRGVSEQGQWSEWINFFLRGVATQARKARESAEQIEKLHVQLRERVSGLHSVYAHQLLDAIFARPIFSATTIAPRARIKNRQTLLNVIAKFEKAGIIIDKFPHRKRKKIYYFEDLMSILK
ncbi:MAG TPA: Fic family protein [Candidatus Paceibacterota bacterium]